MTFGLTSWLKMQFPNLDYEVPVWYPIREQPDHREWLVTNGLGGYSAGTISGAHTRRYHGLLVAALAPPHGRHLILSRVEEQIFIGGREYQLSTNHWASGVVSPTGFKQLESFTILPVPTWVYELDGHYLIKQLILSWGTNELLIGYHWLPDPERASTEATIALRFLTGFRDFNTEVRGSADDRYAQFVFPNRSVIILNESAKRLCLSWSDGTYEPQKQWWWDFHWPEETQRGQLDTEDLFLIGNVTAQLLPEKEFCIGASLDEPIDNLSLKTAVVRVLERQNELIKKASLPRSQRTDMLILSCDQFLVSASPGSVASDIIEGYPWLAEGGRAAMISLPGLTLAVRRFDEARNIIASYSHQMVKGILPSRVLESVSVTDKPNPDYENADVTLWWAWVLCHYFKMTKDKEFIQDQLPLLEEAAKYYLAGTAGGIKLDRTDGLLRCARDNHAFTWMNAMVADIPITQRSGKPVEICALWYSFLETIIYFAQTLSAKSKFVEELEALASLCRDSMQKFWNDERQCLYDVLEPGLNAKALPDDSIRPNQLLAVSLPFRALTTLQEKAVLACVEAELVTPMGLRTLAPSDPAYQGIYGCGFTHADQYHRDLSYHQGTVFPWLLGAYCDALVNVFGLVPETISRIRLVFQPLFEHLTEESCIGSISEIFDGARPHLPRGCFASSWAVAETMRWHNWQLRR
jgi:predicted glycogen debranching enzyme